MIKIPYLTREKAAPLARAIRDTALTTGASEYQVYLMMTHFFENIVKEIAKDNTVRIPAFGIFYAYRYVPKKKGLAAYAAPAFYFARFARVEVRNCCSEYPVSGNALPRFRKRNFGPNSGPPTGYNKSLHPAMETIRQSIRKQARDIGQEIEFHPDV